MEWDRINHEWPNESQIRKVEWHFHQRLLERYGIILQYGELTNIKATLFGPDSQQYLVPSGNNILHSGLAIFKYNLYRGRHKKRVYILAHPQKQRLVSVRLPRWMSQSRHYKNKRKKAVRRKH